MSFPVSNADRHPGFSGMLEVGDAFSDIDEVMQTTPPIPPGRRTIQFFLRDADPGPGPVALEPMAPDDPRYPPADRIFSIRDGTERVIGTTMIVIERRPPVHEEVIKICHERGISPSPWVLSAVFVKPEPGDGPFGPPEPTTSGSRIA